MKKQILAMLLALVMCLSLLPTAAFAVEETVESAAETDSGTELGDILGDDVQSAVTADGLEYSCNDTKAVITGYSGTSASVTIPAKVGDGLEVVGLGYQAFYKNKTIATVTIEAEITAISADCFRECSNLTSVALPDSVSVIGEYAFNGCSQLYSLNWPEALTAINSGAFQHCDALSAPIFFDGVSVGSLVFYNCDGLSAVTLKNTSSLGNGAFESCTALKSVTLENVITVGSNVFWDCTTLTELTLTGVTSIGSQAFFGCTALNKAILPDELTTLGSKSFADCSNLSAVFIPDTVTSIADDTFENDQLLTIYGTADSAASSYAEKNGIPFIVGEPGDIISGSSVTANGLVYSCNGTQAVITGYTGDSASVTIPATVGNGLEVIALGYQAFYDNDIITSVTIEAEITAIPAACFEYCSKLTSVTLPDSVSAIGEYAFCGCSKLSSLNWPETLTAIDSGAFQHCDALSAPIFFDGVSVGSLVFYNCDGLSAVTLKNTSSLGNGAFESCTALKSVTLENVTTIGSNVFWDCTALTDLKLTGVTSIGSQAFFGCTALNKTILPDELTALGSKSFADCSNLSAVFIPDTVTSIADDTFENDQLLTIYGTANSAAASYAEENDFPFVVGEPGDIISGSSVTADGLVYSYSGTQAVITSYTGDSASVTIPAKVGEGLDVIALGYQAFYKNKTIATVTIEAEITAIPANCFWDCSNLTAITLPDSVSVIGEYAFCGCSKLSSLNWPEALTAINSGAFQHCDVLSAPISFDGVSVGSLVFYNCDGLSAVTLKNTSSLGNGAFESCTALKSVTLENVSVIGSNVFWDCTALTDLTLSGVTSIGSQAFYGCTALNKVILPDGLTTLGSKSFAECTNLSGVFIPATTTSIADDAFENDEFLIISTDCTEDEDEESHPVLKFAKKKGHRHMKLKFHDKGWHGHFGKDHVHGHNGKHGMYWLTKDGWAWFDPDAVDHIQDNTPGDLEMNCDEITDPPETGNKKRDDAVKDSQNKGGKVYDFTLTSEDEDVSFSDGEGGYVEIRVRHESGHKAVHVYHIDDDGNKTEVPSSYDKHSGHVTFKTNHFSYYTIESGEPETEKIDFAFARMILGNALDMQFAFPQEGVAEGAYVEVVRTAADGTEVPQTIAYEEFKTASINGVAHYYVTYTGIAAKQMADTIVATVYAADGTAISNGWTDSVREYALRSLRAEGASEKNKTMLVDMLNYGAAAQVYFTYNADDLANKDLTDAEKALATTADECVNEVVKGAKNKGSRLILESSIKVQQAFAGLNENMYATVTFTNYNGRKVSETIEGSAFQIASVSIIELDQVVLADARTIYTLTIYNADGTVYDTHVDSVASYIARASENALYDAIMNFADSAYNYLKS